MKFQKMLTVLVSALCLFTASAFGELIYSTSFSNPPFTGGVNTWAGTDGWLSTDPTSGSQGVIVDGGGTPVAGYLGFNTPAAQQTLVWKPLTFDVAAAGNPIVQFGMDLAIVNSTNSQFDSYYISIYNSANEFLAAVVFDNRTLDILRTDSITSTDTGVNFVNGVYRRLEFSIDYAANTWSATYGGSTLFTSTPFHSGGKVRDLGVLGYVWYVTTLATPGNNYLLVDSISITALLPEISVFNLASTAVGDERQNNSGTSLFPNTLIGTSSSPQIYTVKNSGTSPLTGLALSKGVSGNPDDFTPGSLGSTTLAPGATTTFTITFSPSVVGSRNAVVQIASNDANENPFLINVSGDATSGSVNASYTTGNEVPLTLPSYTATGNTVNFTLNYAPVVGKELMVVKNTGLGFITGTFDNLAQGQKVALAYGGVNYHFVANYYGGTGNDLVLVWASNRVFGWGVSNDGEVAVQNPPLPTPITATGVLAGKTVVSMAAGQNHSLVLCSDGTLAAWGDSTHGQIGDNDITDRYAPVLVNRANGVSALFGKVVVAIAAGRTHSLALCSDGTVVAWGYNAFGALGDNTTTNRLVPVAVNTTNGVSALFGKTVVAIAAGGSHSLARCSDGTVVAWGYNGAGELGDSPSVTIFRSVPVAVNTSSGVSALFGKTVVEIAGGQSHSLALCSDGTLVGWGHGQSGALGNNSTGDFRVPVLVNATGASALLGKTVVAIAASGYGSCALCSDGTVAAWGWNFYGAVGNNSTTDRLIPTAVNTTSGVSALFGKTVVGISAGYGHKLALCSDGTMAAWGYNASGQVGDNTTVQRNVPVTVNTTRLAPGERFIGVCKQVDSIHSLALVASANPEIDVFNGASTPPANERQSNTGSVTFADQLTGVSSSAQTFTIKNSGPGTLSGLALSVTGAHFGNFTHSTLGATTLAPGATATFTVTFSPSAIGVRSAVVQIASNDSDEAAFLI